MVLVLQVDGPARPGLLGRVRAAVVGEVVGRGVAVDGAGRHAMGGDGRLEGRLAASDVRYVVCDECHAGHLNWDSTGTMLRCDAQKCDGDGAMERCYDAMLNARWRWCDVTMRCSTRDGDGAMYDAMLKSAMAMKRC